MLSAFLDFLVPTSITDAKFWFDLIKQVTYTFSASKEMQPFHEPFTLCNWYWDSNMDSLFQISRVVILQLIHQGEKISSQIGQLACQLTGRKMA